MMSDSVGGGKESISRGHGDTEGQNIKILTIKKKMTVFVSITFGILTLLYFIPRYGWRLFGFTRCSNPSMITIGAITLDYDNNFIEITGSTSSSAAAYVGTIHKQEGNTLHIGIKYNFLLGFTKRNGDFDIKITINPNDIEKITIKGNQEEKTILER